MKIAVSASAPDMNAVMDERFGRAPYFVIVDSDNDDFSVIDNAVNVEAAQGAGNKSAETLIRQGVGAVVTGHCGPNAFRVLNAAGVAVYSHSGTTVMDAVKKFKSGTLQPIPGADVNGHWK